MKLSGARTLITGCSSGIGRALAFEMSAAGADVWATSRQQASILDLEEHGIRTLSLDVTRPEDVSRAIVEIEGVDILINNAGYGVEGAVEEIDDDSLREQYETNVFGPWRLCRAVLPNMRLRGVGAIVNISSFAAHVPFPGIGAYRSSKFALDGFTWTLHLEVAHFGIRVISIEPGLVDTDFGTRSIRRGAGYRVGSPYGLMRESAATAYPRMSPFALPPEVVARAVVSELQAESGPLHVRVGEDAERMVKSIAAGEWEYQRYLVEDLGFGWHPMPDSLSDTKLDQSEGN